MPPRKTTFTSFNELPSDILIEIAGYLEPLDVLELRQTSKTLYDITYERDVWARVYVRSSHPRPGPLNLHQSQSREVLESTIARSAAIDRCMFRETCTPPRPKTHRRAFHFPSWNETSFKLLKGRWLISKGRHALLCRDLDAVDIQPNIICEAEVPYTVHQYDAVEIVGDDCRWHGYLAYMRIHPLERERHHIYVLEASDTSMGLSFTEIYHYSSMAVMDHWPLRLYIGPSACCLMWGADDSQIFPVASEFVVWDFDSPAFPRDAPVHSLVSISDESIRRMFDDMGFIIDAILTQTYLIMLGKFDTEVHIEGLRSNMWVYAIPLRAAWAGEMSGPGENTPCFVGFSDLSLSWPAIPVLLRDAVTSPVVYPPGITIEGCSGYTHVTVAGLRHQLPSGVIPSEIPLFVTHLTVPPVDAPPQTRIGIRAEFVTDMPSYSYYQCISGALCPTLCGAMRVLRASLEDVPGPDGLAQGYIRLGAFDIRLVDSDDDPSNDVEGNRHDLEGSRTGYEAILAPTCKVAFKESSTVLVGDEGAGAEWIRCLVACVDLQRGRVCIQRDLGDRRKYKSSRINLAQKSEFVVLDFA